jgi:HK97 family phage prohead protease
MDKSNNIERRYVAEVRKAEDDPESRRVSGYAAVFGSSSLPLMDWDHGEFEEVIDRNAFDGVIEQSDVFAVLNHDNSRGVLGRSINGTGSLSLSVDDHGLRYEFDAPRTALGDELLEGLRRGDITASSFAFNVQDERWEEQENKTYKRTILKIRRLYDVSPVYNPAYPDTSVAQRSLDETLHNTTNNNTITYNNFTL